MIYKNNNTIIEVNNVSMLFNVANEKVDSIKEYVLKFITRKLFFNEFWALSDISVKVDYGEIFGIIGDNGAGKSTLLKIIAGVMKPTKGRTIVKGTMAPLIELGAGFDMELSARENIFLNGTILGYSKHYIRDKFDQIVEFSELRDFIDMPIKNYSSGMIARLGFAVATVTEPDILIIDELLGVGDFKFRQKCQERIYSMMNNNATVILVSHSTEQVESICRRALWLEKGRLKMVGEAKVVCEAYRQE